MGALKHFCYILLLLEDGTTYLIDDGGRTTREKGAPRPNDKRANRTTARDFCDKNYRNL